MPRLAPRLIPIAAALVALLSLGACQSQIDAPTNVGVCYHLAAIQDGKAKFNVVASNVPDMEHCAAHLEAMRTHFLSLGGTITDIVGAYQGNFLFLGGPGRLHFGHLPGRPLSLPGPQRRPARPCRLGALVGWRGVAAQ
jgi:hypothetical protein